MIMAKRKSERQELATHPYNYPTNTLKGKFFYART